MPSVNYLLIFYFTLLFRNSAANLLRPPDPFDYSTYRLLLNRLRRVKVVLS